MKERGRGEKEREGGRGEGRRLRKLKRLHDSHEKEVEAKRNSFGM